VTGSFLETDRLRMHRWTAEDLGSATELWGDPNVTELIDGRGKLDEGQVRARLEMELEYDRRTRLQYWPLILRVSGEFVGCCGLHPENAVDDTPELGFHLCHRWWGKGLAKEAAFAIVEHAFADLGIPALFAGHHPKNFASASILQSLGFSKTGSNLYPPTGLIHPSYILKKETYLSLPDRHT